MHKDDSEGVGPESIGAPQIPSNQEECTLDARFSPKLHAKQHKKKLYLDPARIELLRRNGRSTVYDTECRNLFLETKGDGRQTYYCVDASGNKRFLGRADQLISLESARRRASQYAQSLAAQGGISRLKRSDSITVGILTDDFVSERVPWLGFHSGNEARSVTVRLVKPLFGEYLISEITQERIVAILDERPEFSDSQKERARRYLSSVLTWGVRNDLLDRNPLMAAWSPRLRVSISSRLHGQRNWTLDEKDPKYWAVNLKQIARIYLYAEGLPEPWDSIIRLCLLTGQREKQIRAIKWKHLDVDERILRFENPSLRPGRVHGIFVTDDVLAILEALQPSTGAFVFQSARNPEQPIERRSNIFTSMKYDTDYRSIERLRDCLIDHWLERQHSPEEIAITMDLRTQITSFNRFNRFSDLSYRTGGVLRDWSKLLMHQVAELRAERASRNTSMSNNNSIFDIVL